MAADLANADAQARILAILRSAPLPDEGAHLAGERKERELKLELASLAPADALMIRKRFQGEKPDDELAVAFKRLNVERRDRLIAFLSDPRRPLFRG